MLRIGTPDWSEIIRAYVAEGTSDLAVAIPGNVVSYANGLADVRPGVRKLVPDEDDPEFDYTEAYPVIPSVPVMWPRGRNFQIVGSLGVGDPVLLVCADYDISAWMRSGTLSDPEDARGHDYGHGAVAIPGLVPDAGWAASAPTDAAALASKMDAVFRAQSAIADPTDLASLIVAVKALVAAVKVSYPSTGGIPSTSTAASSVVKVSS